MNCNNCGNVLLPSDKVCPICSTPNPNYRKKEAKSKPNTNALMVLTAIFSLIIILKRILREEDFKNMMSELENKINTLAYNLKTIDISIIRDILGFPNNWLDLINLEENGEEYE